MRATASYLLVIIALALSVAPTLAQIPSPTTADEPPDEEVPVDAPPDQRIQERIGAVLQHIDRFDEVSISVHDGVVILQGEVDNAQDRENAATLINRFEGVIWVDNRLEVATDVETRIAPALQRIQRFARRSIAYIPIGLLIILVVVLLWRAGSLIASWEAPAKRFGWNPLVWGLFRRLVRAVIVLLGLLLIFDVLGVSALVGALLGTAGVVGLALGFAFQDIAENYLAGVLMSIRQPFNINDLVRIDQHEGFVVRLTSRELVLLTLEGNHVRLPNAAVFKSTIINFSRNPRRQFNFDIGIGTGESLSNVARIGRELLVEMPGVLDDPQPFVRVMEVGDSSVRVRFHGWVDQRAADFAKVRSEAIRLVKEGLDAADIDLPDPRFQITLQRDGQTRRAIAEGDAPAEIDVSPDRKMDAQVEEDLAGSDEENLLDN